MSYKLSAVFISDMGKFSIILGNFVIILRIVFFFYYYIIIYYKELFLWLI